eukprot:14028-Amphidinium_carterae.2
MYTAIVLDDGKQQIKKNYQSNDSVTPTSLEDGNPSIGLQDCLHTRANSYKLAFGLLGSTACAHATLVSEKWALA